MACMGPYMVLGYGCQERSTREAKKLDEDFRLFSTSDISNITPSRG